MAILDTLLEITVYSALLFAAIALFKLIFKSKLSPLLHFVVWFILIARLCLPITLESGYHFFTTGQTTQTNTPVTIENEATKPIVNAGGEAHPHAAYNTHNADKSAKEAAETIKTSSAFRLSWTDGLVMLWCAGVGFFAIKLLLTERKMRRAIAKNSQRPDARTSCIYAECLER